MALKIHILVLIYILSISLYTLHAHEKTSAPAPSDAPTPSDPDAEADADADEDALTPSEMDALTPTKAKDEDEDEDEDEGSLAPSEAPTSPTPFDDTPATAGGPTSDEDVTSAGGPSSEEEDVTSAGGPSSDEDDEDDISVSENFELSLPEIGVQNKLSISEPDGPKIAIKQLQAIEHKINEFKAGLDKRMDDPNTSDETKHCIQSCQDKFEAKLDAIKTTLESIDKKDYPKANDCVNVITTDADMCNECFIEMMAEDNEIRSFEEWIKGVTGECASNLPKEWNSI